VVKILSYGGEVWESDFVELLKKNGPMPLGYKKEHGIS
jgi:hypothetical protein